MRRLIVSLPALLLLPGCGGGGSSGSGGNVPAAATAMDANLKTGMVRLAPMFANIETSLVFVLNPGTPTAQGVTLSPDNSPGAMPNSVVFSGPFDGNGDGFNETTVNGRATFNSDPASAWSGVGGQSAIDIAIPLLGHVYHADIAFTVASAEKRLSGSGRFTDPLSGATTTMTVSAAAPLVVKAATGAADAAANACGYSLDGELQLSVAAAAGTLSSLWSFSSANPITTVSGVVFTDAMGQSTPLPDATVDLRCGGSGSINDWAAAFDQSYACLPRETGQARLTLVVSAPDTVTITDEDPPGSGIVKSYPATVLPGNPHALRGFFIGGPVGNRYREDFSWTLGKNGTTFAQTSSYVYMEGPAIGSGGFCVASARRMP